MCLCSMWQLVQQQSMADKPCGSTVQADATALAAKETQRAEAAAQLERRMAAMEAVLAARRSPVAEAKPEAARGPGADLRFQVRSLQAACSATSMHVACDDICTKQFSMSVLCVIHKFSCCCGRWLKSWSVVSSTCVVCLIYEQHVLVMLCVIAHVSCCTHTAANVALCPTAGRWCNSIWPSAGQWV